MNKYKSLMLILFFIFYLSVAKVSAINNNLLGKSICLDPGHGGKDAGAVSEYIIEKELNLELVKLLEKELVKRGSYVLLTREDDYELTKSSYNRKRNDLYNRAMLINNSNCDIYISIHLNSINNSSWRGLQIFYNSKLEENKNLATVMNEILSKNISNIRDIKVVNDYYMYRLIDKPGILIEAGFISNPNDNYLLRQTDYKNKLVFNIANGVESYFN